MSKYTKQTITFDLYLTEEDAALLQAMLANRDERSRANGQPDGWTIEELAMVALRARMQDFEQFLKHQEGGRK